MLGRKVSSAWHRLASGEIVKWEPLGAAMCDVLVRDGLGRVCWYASSDLSPIDGLGPLPSRAVAREWARVIALDDVRAMRAALVARWHEPWPGAEFGKAIVGQSIEGAIVELLARGGR